MDIRTPRYLVEVVRQQSFTHVAEKLFVTQPIISRMLKNLEDELNRTLLIRDGHKLLLTDAGRVVFECDQAIPGEFSQPESELSDINHLHKGVLRPGTPPMVGMLMAEPISRFCECYPGVGSKTAEFGGLTVQQVVSNGELDMAMTVLPIGEGSHLTILSLFNHLLCVLTPRIVPWEGVTSLSPAELATYPPVIYNGEFALSQQLMCLFTEHDIKSRAAARSGQWDFLAVMVQAGTGVAILSKPICQCLDPQNFCWIPLQSELRWELGMTWREGVYMSCSAEAWLTYSKAFWLE